MAKKIILGSVLLYYIYIERIIKDELILEKKTRIFGPMKMEVVDTLFRCTQLICLAILNYIFKGLNLVCNNK